ncbi:hypothetical protein HZS_1360 [Henneguya salminicola]|nr:hypothetical protein HZS_1360 [Henneguya salminicola]
MFFKNLSEEYSNAATYLIIDFLLAYTSEIMINQKIEISTLIQLYSNYFLRPQDCDLINFTIVEDTNKLLFENIITIIITDNKDDFTYENDVEGYDNQTFIPDLLVEVQTYFHAKTVKCEIIKMFMNEEDGNFLVRKSKSEKFYELLVAVKGKPKIFLIMNISGQCAISKNSTYYCIPDLIKYYKKNHFGSSFPNIPKRLRDPIQETTVFIIGINDKGNHLIKSLDVPRLRVKLSTIEEKSNSYKEKLEKLQRKHEIVTKTLMSVEKVENMITDHLNETEYDECENIDK